MASPHAWRRYRASVFQGYLIAAILAFLVLAVLARTVAYFTFDVVITRNVQTINAIGFDGLMRALSWIGFAPQVGFIAAFVIAFLYVSGLKWESAMTLFGVIGISAIGLAAKILVVRPRPSADLVNVISQLSDFSFPSGHVLFFTTFFGFLLFLGYTLLKATWGRTLLIVLFGGMVGLIGISRIYTGDHWASDVLAAYLLGSVWLALMVHVYRWGKPRFFVTL
ncbi:MAG: phosphatase PAP2 family protein [Chloroflexi bacterium]|nr:phosphatase PAP2 family protein [Chloroflexota bacterium]